MPFSRLAESALFCANFAVARRPCGFDLLGMCNTSGSHGVRTDSV